MMPPLNVTVWALWPPNILVTIDLLTIQRYVKYYHDNSVLLLVTICHRYLAGTYPQHSPALLQQSHPCYCWLLSPTVGRMSCCAWQMASGHKIFGSRTSVGRSSKKPPPMRAINRWWPQSNVVDPAMSYHEMRGSTGHSRPWTAGSTTNVGRHQPWPSLGGLACSWNCWSQRTTSGTMLSMMIATVDW